MYLRIGDFPIDVYAYIYMIFIFCIECGASLKLVLDEQSKYQDIKIFHGCFLFTKLNPTNTDKAEFLRSKSWLLLSNFTRP